MHIHIPDGVFPAWLWLSGIILLIPLIFLAVFFVRKDNKKLIMTSAITALMLIVFSIEIFGYHLNFTALSGIILGPWWSLLSITTVNIFLALFGHGGITVAPINIILNWIESLIAFAFFKLILSKIKNIKVRSALSGISVFISLVISFGLFVSIIGVAGINPALQLEHDHEHENELINEGYNQEIHTEDEHEEDIHENEEVIPLTEFVMISAIPTLIGAIIESILTLFMVIFISKSRPKLLL